MNSENSGLNIGIFVALSIALHVAAGAALYLLAPKARGPEPEKAYIVRIVPLGPESPAPSPEPPAAPKPRPPAIGKVVPRPMPPPKELEARATRPIPPAAPSAPAGKKEAAPEAPEPGEREEAISERPGAVPSPPEEKPRGAAQPKGKPEGGGRDLFDKEVIAGVVEKDRVERPPDSSITFDTREIRYHGYMQRLKERIEYIWEYPPESAARGIYGDLVLRFVIKKDGSLGAVELVRTSGWRDLDAAAIRALRDGGPYWPLPDAWGSDSLTVTGHFIYTLHGGYYIR